MGLGAGCQFGEAQRRDPGLALEQRLGARGAAPANAREVGDRDAGAGHDEALATIEGAHDLAASVTQLALRER
ncbi:MAG TPA: hypothetical protein VF250_13345 [Conexibacter sp.]